MATQWKNFKTAMKEKRTGKRKAPSHDIVQKEETVIQRLSTKVSGKAQKYSHIGPRKFVPFDYKEVTLDSIKNVCRRHFASIVGERMVCDVLAGKQGPSCSSGQQIPDQKVVHVHFIEPNDRDVVAEDRMEVDRLLLKRLFRGANTQSLPVTKVQSPSKTFPKSLSVLEMMRLDKVINGNTVTIDLFMFAIADMTWLSPSVVDFSLAKEGFVKCSKPQVKQQDSVISSGL